MRKQKILAQYCIDNILDIPKGLIDMRDVKPLLLSEDSAIFYKDLEKDLTNIEFYTSLPCVVYNTSGKEIITTSQNRSFEVGQGEAILLPKGLNLYSDYIHEGDGLRAYLLFFGHDVISRFLSTGPAPSSTISNEDAILKLRVGQIVREFFLFLHSAYDSFNNSPHLLKLKLLELLCLLDINDEGCLRKSLLSVQRGKAKRNIRRLMDQYAVSDLTARELAVLSGRSVSTFNREFKTLFNATPKQWLINKRMAHAYSLLTVKQWTVTAVALEVGYSNISHFIETFKKQYEKTPHQIKSEE
jgi:AraC-like DNA-binding protein